MGDAKALLAALLMTSALLAMSHRSYSTTFAARKGAHAHQQARKKTKKKTTHNAPKAHQRTVARVAHAGSLVYTVTATTYQAVASQTDSHPFITADNSTIKRGYSSRLRWVAVSRDLLQPWGGRIHYGDKVHLRGVSPRLDGVYTVHDTMHQRHRRRIDILSSPREKLTISSKNVKLQVVRPTAAHRQPVKPARLASRRATKSLRVAGRPGQRHSGRA